MSEQTIWTHEICYCKYESGFYVKSVHSERVLALRAMLAERRAAVVKGLELRQRCGRDRGSLFEVQPDFDAQMVRGMEVDGQDLPQPLYVPVGRGREW